MLDSTGNRRTIGVNAPLCLFILAISGGPGQVAHLAPTYAAVNALCILGTEEAYQVINR